MNRPELKMTDVWHGYDRQDAIVTIPEGEEHAGTWHGEIRARLLDEATGDWWFQLQYKVGIGEVLIDKFPAEWVRRPDLDDFAGIIPPHILEQMRADRK